mmetsp:Transcript_36348/g.44417  ORF Transcript_36348/g.44417 Transcript_36348/m.44417 type:complete len:232 (-) Transcript_36348:226-921(-)
MRSIFEARQICRRNLLFQPHSRRIRGSLVFIAVHEQNITNDASIINSNVRSFAENCRNVCSCVCPFLEHPFHIPNPVSFSRQPTIKGVPFFLAHRSPHTIQYHRSRQRYETALETTKNGADERSDQPQWAMQGAKSLQCLALGTVGRQYIRRNSHELPRGSKWITTREHHGERRSGTHAKQTRAIDAEIVEDCDGVVARRRHVTCGAGSLHATGISGTGSVDANKPYGFCR